MIAAEPYLKTKRVAQALGVSASTIKRWVDTGMIRAVRTAGKHRLIPVSEAVRLAREQGVHAANIEILAGLGSREMPGIDDRIRDLLFEMLRDGNGSPAKALIQSVYSAGCGATVLADHLIRPVMDRIGHGWLTGALDVYQEHQGTHTVACSIHELINRENRDRKGSRPLALGATTEGDPYVLSSLLGELLLREMGWDVRNLGVNLPLRSLTNATRLYRPQLIFLSINYLEDEETFLREYLSFYQVAAATTTAVIVGGQALSPDLRSKLVYASFGDRMAHLAEFARCIPNHSSPLSASENDEPVDQGPA
jgi:MerR family transcriptional regulator, light-induced transcriptional regulator